MWKAPTEIKKGLEYCFADRMPFSCEECPYYGSIVCKMHLHTDALDYIKQLEDEVLAWHRLYSTIHDETGVVQREVAHQRELLEKNAEIRRMEKVNYELEAQVPRWISVEERLPDIRAENNARQLSDTVYATEKNILMMGAFHINKYDGSWFFDGVDDDGDAVDSTTITHWMPLPEAPKEDAHE